MIEYVDHLHEHFVDPVVIRGGALPRPDRARASRAEHARRRRSTAHRFPDGAVWAAAAGAMTGQ